MEAELVAANDVLLYLVCTKNLLDKKGYDFDPTLNQGNISEILLETNGMESSSRRTRHINIGFYFINDRIFR